MFKVQGEKYIVEKVMQNEVQDIFKITEIQPHNENSEDDVIYEHFPRTMELTAEDVLSYYE